MPNKVIKVKDIKGSYEGLIVNIAGERRAIVSLEEGKILTCSPDDFACENRPILPQVMTSEEIIELKVTGRL